VASIAAGVPAETVAPQIRERQVALAQLEVKLAAPRPARPNIDALRAALTQRVETWKQALRAEPKVARVLLQQLVGPLTLWAGRAGARVDPLGGGGAAGRPRGRSTGSGVPKRLESLQPNSRATRLFRDDTISGRLHTVTRSPASPPS
jgi:hypothetical protein